jgi:hypothetical protein
MKFAESLGGIEIQRERERHPDTWVQLAQCFSANADTYIIWREARKA